MSITQNHDNLHAVKHENIKQGRCGIIHNETTIHKSSNDEDISNYRSSYSLQLWGNPMPYSNSKSSDMKNVKQFKQENQLTYDISYKTVYEKQICHKWTNDNVWITGSWL